MPSHELSRRAFSQMAGSVLAAPLGTSSFTDSLTVPRPSTRWSLDTGGEIGVLPGLHRGTPYIGDALFLDSPETLRAVDRVTGDQRWQFDVGDDSWGLEVGSDAVYVADGDVLHSLDVDGAKRWESRLEGNRNSVYGATEVGDTVYASSTGGLYALDASSGDREWEFEENLGTPTVTADAVYGTTQGLTTDTLYALDPSDGRKHWRFEVKDDEDGHLFLAGVADQTCYLWRRGDLYAVDARTGAELWQFGTGGDSLGYHGRFAEKIAYVWSKDEQTLHALDLRSGAVEWQFEVDSKPWYTIEVVDDAIVFETEAAVYALDAMDGTQRWRYARELNPKQFAGDVGGGAVYTQDEGALYALDVADGSTRWQFAPDDEEVAYARRIGDTVYAGTNAGTLFALEGPARTPIDAAVHDLRTNAGAVSLVSLLGGGLVAAGYRKLQEQESDEEPDGDAADAGIELREPIDADGPLESYEACLPDGRDVVAKRLSEDANVANDQFLRAVETWADLDHENIRSVLDRGTEPAPWVALRSATDQPVADCEEMTVTERVETLATACEAVHAAHRDEVDHGHLSPEDVRFPSRDCQPADVWVGGWLARILPEDSRSAYAAPEQADNREADPIRTDIYRLGAVTYHSITGQPPKRDAEELTPLDGSNAEIPTEIGDVLADAMAADPDERYRSALKLADMLRWAVRQ